MDVSSCCGAEVKTSPDGWELYCPSCSAILDICEDVVKQDKPSIVVVEIPPIDTEIHEHPLGAGFAHKDTKANG